MTAEEALATDCSANPVSNRLYRCSLTVHEDKAPELFYTLPTLRCRFIPPYASGIAPFWFGVYLARNPTTPNQIP